MPSFKTSTAAASIAQPAYNRVVRVPFVPPKADSKLPHPYSDATCVRCVEGGGAQWNLFDARDIGHFYAQDKYTCFSWAWPEGAKEQLLDASLRQLELRLVDHGFVRVHRRALINLRFVRQIKLICGADGARAQILLANGERVLASRRGTRLLKQRLLHLDTASRPAPRRRAACSGTAVGSRPRLSQAAAKVGGRSRVSAPGAA